MMKSKAKKKMHLREDEDLFTNHPQFFGTVMIPQLSVNFSLG